MSQHCLKSMTNLQLVIVRCPKLIETSTGKRRDSREAQVSLDVC